MEAHNRNALALAHWLEKHPKVKAVLHPGLESHPHHELAKRQMFGFGGMITFQLKGGLGAAITMAEKIRVFSYATSLGHAHSLLFYYPTDLYVDATPYYTKEQVARIREWTGEGIVRASVGLESPKDLIADLDRALNARTVKGMVGAPAYKLMKLLTANKKTKI
jgi:cystathionine beta-lyase/cystathionine gamma-synthase